MFWVLNYHEINPADSCCSCSSFKWKRWPSAYWQASVRASIFDNQTSIIPNKLFITDLPGRRRSWCICFACSLTSLCLSPSILRRRRVFAARLGGWGDNSSSPAAPSQTELSTNPSSVTPHADLSNSPQVLFRTLLLLMNSSLSQPDSNVRKMTAFFFLKDKASKREDQMCISFVLSLMADWRNRLWFIAKHAVHFSYARCGPEWTSSLNGPRKCTVCCSRNTKESDREEPECQPGVRSHGICLMSGVVVGTVARLARKQVHLVLSDFVPWCLSCVTPCPFRKKKQNTVASREELHHVSLCLWWYFEHLMWWNTWWKLLIPLLCLTTTQFKIWAFPNNEPSQTTLV